MGRRDESGEGNAMNREERRDKSGDWRRDESRLYGRCADAG